MTEQSEPTPEQSAASSAPERSTLTPQERLTQTYVVPAPEARASSHPESEPGDLVSMADPEEFFTPIEAEADGTVNRNAVASSLGFFDNKVEHSANYDELVAHLQDMELQGLVSFEEGQQRTPSHASFPYDEVTVQAPGDRTISSRELYERGYARLRTLDRIEAGLPTPETARVNADLYRQELAQQQSAATEEAKQAEARQAAEAHRANRLAEAQAKLDTAAQGKSNSANTEPAAEEPVINLAPTDDMVEARVGEGPFKVDRAGDATPTTHGEMEAARTEHAAQTADKHLLRPLPPAEAVDTSRRPDVRADGKNESHYVTNVDQAMEMAFQNDRGAAEMNALAAEYRMQHELLTRETNTSLTHDREVNGEVQKGTMTLLEESYKSAIKEVRDRYQKYKGSANDTIAQLNVAKARHQDLEISIVSDSKGDAAGKAWVLRHELGIPDGARPIPGYGNERGFGGLFHGSRDRGRRMVQRVYQIPTGGQLVEVIDAKDGKFVRSTVVFSARQPMRYGYFRMPFTGTDLEAKMKSLRQADLRREPPRNIGDYFGLRWGPKMPGRSGQFAYDMAGTAAWDTQMGGSLYNKRRRVPWYLQLATIRGRQH